MTREKIEQLESGDLIRGAYYAINYFHSKGKEMSNIKLQKILYFAEAYYMSQVSNGMTLFDTKWLAKENGPMDENLYEYFKPFKYDDISLSEKNVQMGEKASDKVKDAIRVVYDNLGMFDTYQLIYLTHLKGSPWDCLLEKYGVEKLKKYEFELNKEDVSKWFNTTFIEKSSSDGK